MKLYEEQNGKYPEEMNKKEFFSTEAIIDNLVIDDDIYSHLRKHTWLLSKEKLLNTLLLL